MNKRKKLLIILFSIIWIVFLIAFFYRTISKVDFHERFFLDGVLFGFFLFFPAYILRRWYDEIKTDKE